MTTLAFLSSIGLPELIVILVIVLLLFGHRLPGVGRALGKSVHEFKAGVREGQEEAGKTAAPPASPASSPPAAAPAGENK